MIHGPSNVKYIIYVTQIAGSNTLMFKMDKKCLSALWYCISYSSLQTVADWITYQKGEEVDGVVLFLQDEQKIGRLFSSLKQLHANSLLPQQWEEQHQHFNRTTFYCAQPLFWIIPVHIQGIHNTTLVQCLVFKLNF